ncbi:Peritrophin-1 [Trachymyrmex septentrionalis]|uniref:Peritrophin-1 n=1 Tax=Trachymyrmex septentrionalis TaxID=34720 RepID=A0A195FP78_9HYME|nr:Peritrophin-1 [Trachymyrmex septentrionalis]
MGVKGKPLDCPFMDENGNKLHFNPELQVCDWPWSAGCRTSSNSTTSSKARIAHPCLCNRYYDCIDGEKILQTCPIGKHFDYLREICDWTSIVKCIRPIPTFNILTSDIDDYNTTCAPEGRAFQHDTDCSAYYLCSNGEKILRQCMEGLHFNMTIQTCDYPQKSCDLNRSLPRINSDICPPDSVQEVFLPHECECTQYYECIDGKKFLRFCPNRLHFDPVWQICNDPIEAKCVADTISTTSTSIYTTSSTTEAINEPRTTCPPKGSTEKVRLPHPCLCNQYYECVEGDKVLRTCPIDTYFNDATDVCDWSTEVKCISQFPSHEIQIKSYDINNKCSPNGRAFNHEDSCTEYYLCSEGEKVLQYCLEGLHFNVTIQMCDYPQKKCNLNTSGPQPIPTVALNICPLDSIQQILLPHECNCTQYYECIDGKQILRDCSDGLHYDYVRQICNVPIEAKCNDFTTTIPQSSFPTIPDSSKCYDENNEIPHENDCRFYYKCNNVQNLDPITCIGTCPEEDPDYAVLLPNDDCKKFCMCSGGVAWVQPCPEPLYFDSVEKICKKKKDAVCGIRLYNQDRFIKTDKMDNDDSLQSLTDKNDDDEREIYDRSLDPSSCIGTCLEEDPEHAVLLSNNDCKKFCLCSNGTTYVQQCPELLYFDSIDKTCKRKKDAVCAVRSLMVDKIFDDDSVSLSKKDYNERELYDNPWYKRRFYNVDPSTCIGICPEEDTGYEELLPHKDCRKFCICRKGLTYVQLCPESLYFHSVEKVCRQRRHAVCAINSFKRYHAITINREDDEDDDEDNSMEFLRENNKRRRHNYLWPYFHNFNPTTCIEVRERNDEREINNFWSTLHFQDISTCIGTCFNEDYDYAVLLPNLDCRKFCVCSKGLIWIQSCPKSFYFDFVDNICKLKRNAICAVNLYTNRYFTFDKVIDENNSMTSSSEEKNHYNKTRDNTSKFYFSNHQSFNDLDPSTCIGTCPEEDPEYAVLLPNDDCKKFCMCSGGVAWVQPCPEPLYFDSVEKICKKKKHAVCGVRAYNEDSTFMIDKTIDNDDSMKTLTTKNNERATYDNLDPSTCIGTCPEEDPDYAVLLPNDDCKKFCMCSGGVAWVQPCPDPLYFDSVQKTCTRKKNAVCGVRLFKDRVFMINEKW